MRDGHPLRLAIDLQTVEATRLDRPAVLGAERLQVHARKVEDLDGAVDIALRGANMALGKDIASRPCRSYGTDNRACGRSVPRLRPLPATVSFRTWPFSRWMVRRSRCPQGTITWGENRRNGIRRDGHRRQRHRPMAASTTTLRGHDVIIDGLIRQKLIASNMEGTLKTAMSVLSLASGADPGQLRLPLIIKNDDVFLGPVRLTSTAGDTP